MDIPKGDKNPILPLINADDTDQNGFHRLGEFNAVAVIC